MKCRWLSFLWLTLPASILIPHAFADPLYKNTEVKFNAPVEIPGMVLPAGTYVMKLLDPLATQNVVQFYDPDEKHMYAMVFAIPAYRVNPPDHTVITFEERVGNSPQAIKDWFTAGDHWGEEFVYPKVKPAEIAQAAPPPTPAPAKPAPTSTPAAPQHQAATPPASRPQPQPAQVAQAQPAPARPAVPVTPAAPAQKELPKTASDLPLAALIGGVLLLAGACLRRRAA
jgi:outer membrane biosynthesis protein TonB